VGPVLAAVFVAEIGDIHRFAGGRQLCSWAEFTPRHGQSDTTVRRGPITKQGPRLVRWAAVEATQRLPREAGAGPRDPSDRQAPPMPAPYGTEMARPAGQAGGR
jgi:transposase